MLYVRSASVSARSLSTSYRIWTPWLGSPTSYASGYISAHRTATESQSLTVEFSSPPTYWIGLPTSGSSGSSRGNSDSTVMGHKGKRYGPERRCGPVNAGPGSALGPGFSDG